MPLKVSRDNKLYTLVPHIRKKLLDAIKFNRTEEVQSLKTRLHKFANRLHKLNIRRVQSERAQLDRFRQKRSAQRKAERIATRNSTCCEEPNYSKCYKEDSDHSSADHFSRPNQLQLQRPKPNLYSFFNLV